jgi:CubicO group peptidase (beta-lactamase class C family)
MRTEAMNELTSRLRELTKKFDVPGASVAILTDDGIETAVAGVLNRNTKVTVTPDSIFQYGSITKVYTTTLVMQLIDEGLVDLDEPVVTYLPTFKLKDPGAEQITVRHLLTHTNGIEGDYFRDFGRGEDAVEKYVNSLRTIGLAHPTGAFWSYSNAGFVVAGRLVEVLTGMTWDDAMRTKIFEPAGLEEHSAVGTAAFDGTGGGDAARVGSRHRRVRGDPHERRAGRERRADPLAGIDEVDADRAVQAPGRERRDGARVDHGGMERHEDLLAQRRHARSALVPVDRPGGTAGGVHPDELGRRRRARRRTFAGTVRGSVQDHASGVARGSEATREARSEQIRR